MYHGLSNDFLYAAARIYATFRDITGDEKELSGTGFFVKNEKNKMCFVTNRHMVDITYDDPEDENTGYSLTTFNVCYRNKDSSNLPELLDSFNIDLKTLVLPNDPNDDVAAFVDVIPNSPANKHVDFFISHHFLATNQTISSSISVCDFVAFTGFPEWHDKKNFRPIFRVGTIASDPRYDYELNNVKGSCIAYEAFSYGGSSGSPVFALQKGIKPGKGLRFSGFRDVYLIGVNAGHFNTKEDLTHSGMSYFYKSSVVLELIDRL